MKRGVTPIENLVDLDEQERTTRNKELEKISLKSIRNTGKHGGMKDYETHYNSPVELYEIEEKPTLQFHSQKSGQHFQEIEPVQVKEQYHNRFYNDWRGISCLDICAHTGECPVCSRLYSNQDRSIYIAVIVVLVIVCIILLKRVMEIK